jgi:hypothetical protein
MGLPPEYWFGNLPHRFEDELEPWEKSRIGLIPDRRARAKTVPAEHKRAPS